MKILWICNIEIPVISLHRKSSRINNLCGWLTGFLDSILSESSGIELLICYRGSKRDNFVTKISDELSYISFTLEEKKDFFSNVCSDYNPDIIHIFGTEYSFCLNCVDAAIDNQMLDRVVVSIQGLISKCAESYYADLPEKLIHEKSTIYDIIRKNSVAEQQHNFYKRGLYEIEMLKKVKHVIGRTEWDKESVMKINPSVEYIFCNETLRKEFYEGKWVYDKCVKHSIFVSQATYSIKGFHLLIEALTLLIKKYPDIMVFVGGTDITATKSITDKLKLSSYGKYLKKQIKKNGLEKHIVFLGKLNAEQMKEQYLKANVFVSCSVVENSPNSVGEAMMLGTPVVSSNVGGVSSVIEDKTEGLLYQWNNIVDLSECISSVFDDTDSAILRAENAYAHALKTHNSDENLKTLLAIYKNIGGDNN